MAARQDIEALQHRQMVHDIRRPAVAVEAQDCVLGEEYTDLVTGIKGTALLIYLSLSGCDQVCMSYVVGGEEKYLVVDATRLKELRTEKQQEAARPGGPARSAPPSRPSPR